MRVVSITCVKNECDIIEAFARHTAALVNHLVILDNGSTDGTLDILRALEKERLPLDIVEIPRPGKYQWLHMTRLMREFSVERHGADWVLPLDADELLVGSIQGLTATPAARGRRPLAHSTQLYAPAPCDDSTEVNPVVRIRHRVADWAGFPKVIIPRAIAGHPQAILEQGSHAVHIGAHPCTPDGWPSSHLAHIPVRTPGQYVTKMAINALQYLAMGEANLGWGAHYRSALADIAQDPAAFAGSYRDMRLYAANPTVGDATPGLVEDPIPYRGGPLRYTQPINDFVHPLATLIRYAEELATHYGRLAFQAIPEDPIERALAVSLIGRFHTEHERVLAEIRRSWTWKVGRAVIGPIHWLTRRVARKSP